MKQNSEPSTKPLVAIVGRPNVGKSTLFNRIAGRRRALVGNEPGMTRDRIYAPAEWQGKSFQVIDTGGVDFDAESPIAAEILSQASVAIEEAGHCVLVVDARQGVMPLDQDLASLLRRRGKSVALAVNKVDPGSPTRLAGEFYRLGFPDLFEISAEHGLGLDGLLDYVTRDFPAGVETAAGEDEPVIRVAIIGRPNVGKSTLLNRLLGEERSIVTPLAGTTRDAVDASLASLGRRFHLIDTAGIRRKGKTRLLAEKLSVIQARRHLERSDVALLMLDATEGVLALDTHIGGYAHESGRSVVIVVNKWDAVKKGPATTHDYEKAIREQLKYLDYAPIIFLSALKGQRVDRLLEIVAQVGDARRERVSTAEMNKFLETLDLGRAPSPAGKPLRLYYITQAGTAPPTFVAFTNRPGPLYFSIERFLENRIRARFGFPGAPIIIKAKLKR